ncbi:hypothetical protein DENIS_4438 [Desulfonema ishimotonii]|uniref:Uncharacterized protein n=1 Tax=Desulfonema ishimotonii TaxID=45657 RepID=A0A401G2J3_9BACT|nr:hypothetical protein [Desulfonema ishimotonii]GBC63444.1 hypothetical protein DENIS_4438 [Desulfonema ishimotonii]
MENMEKIIRWIEDGKQLGKVFSFEDSGKTFWSSVGIQKWRGSYKVYVDEIEEGKMVAEEYLTDEIKQFDMLSKALNFIDNNTKINAKDLRPCKGQKIFNPEFE